jgi:hypothetical protein
MYSTLGRFITFGLVEGTWFPGLDSLILSEEVVEQQSSVMLMDVGKRCRLIA